MKQNITKITLMIAALMAGISISISMPNTPATKIRKQESEKEEKKGRAQDQEKRVKMKDLPEAVQKTVREQSKGAIIRGLAEETENGKTNYEVELKVNGHNKDVLIDPTGAVVVVEEEVTLESLPALVKTAIEQNAVNGKIKMVESITEGGVIVAYEAHIKKAGKSIEIKVSPDGQLIKD